MTEKMRSRATICAPSSYVYIVHKSHTIAFANAIDQLHKKTHKRRTSPCCWSNIFLADLWGRRLI
jgi:hypothetical protein